MLMVSIVITNALVSQSLPFLLATDTNLFQFKLEIATKNLQKSLEELESVLTLLS